MFTTRPEILGSIGVVTSTHWVASSVGMAMIERGGNAFDAAVATGFVLQVVQPNLCGPGGDVPIIFHSARTGKTEVLCGQGTAPKRATIEHYRSEGLTLIPGNGLLATVIPSSFDAWMLLLRDHGTLTVRDVLQPAAHYAEHGHPVSNHVSGTVARLLPFFEKNWPTTLSLYAPNATAIETGSLLRNPALANTWNRIIREAESVSGREAQIEKARDAFYRGFVAEAIERFINESAVMDDSGHVHKGVLGADDMADWRATYENTESYDYHDHTVHKTAAWGQGPSFLQMLALLKRTDIAALDPVGSDFVHLVAEAIKLGFADREYFYGDPEFNAVPMRHLLSDAYNDQRATLITDQASMEFRPGLVPGYEKQVERVSSVLAHYSKIAAADAAIMEPTLAAMRAEGRGDTVHLDCADAQGNLVAAMPSGGWFQSSPVIPELGFPLNSRAQMFWLEPGLANSLAPGRRPRTTLTPTLVHRRGKPYLAFGSPGGDQQEQWQLQFFLRLVHGKMGLQEAIDLPMFYTAHAPSSFFPREQRPGHLAVEESFGAEAISALRRRGHFVDVAPPWTISSIVAAARDENGILHGAATPRLMQAYAVGR
ncbi:gamma-glutamyltransferase family protein [Tianweitania sediminis]|uniref:Gamma-glutamyltransferase family protein n=1 Tax=Tianweitania sediminis TaxID=1502156 RepID=A0A8J7R0Y8_9HYPH|nr:gamma-glutamyltransferase family protein [Tianweitania sediminis]MBP0440030.1 gamma-glutamyltransferase family protein [Tianweitania sediminis]